MSDLSHHDGLLDRIEELEDKLAKKDGSLEETYRRWKNGADLRALAKAEGCTQERMRHKMKRYEEDKVRLLESKLAKAVGALGDIYDGEPEWPDDPKKELDWCRNRARATLAELRGETDDQER